jgi:hypothetical protein
MALLLTVEAWPHLHAHSLPCPCQHRLTVLLPFTALARATTRQGEDGGSLRWSHPDALLLALSLIVLLHLSVPSVTTVPAEDARTSMTMPATGAHRTPRHGHGAATIWPPRAPASLAYKTST